jgi:UPF0755 protein
MKKYKITLLGIVISFIIIAVFIFYQLYVPVSNIVAPKFIKIQKGMSVKDISYLLKKEGLIRNELLFLILAKFFRAESALKAGTYKLGPSMNMLEIFKIIKSGEFIPCYFTIPPGYTIPQIASLLKKKGIIKEREYFINLAYNEEFVNSLGISSKNLEGYLFPTTYFVPPDIREEVKVEELLKIMVKKFKKKVLSRRDYQKACKSLGLSMHQIITLASIIEKETSLKYEKPIISGVLYNRLRYNMPLCSDPTVIYALGDRFDGNLKKEDLRIDSLYNTYRYKGLPPTPICNPGEDSIEAALYPAKVNYLYFVSMNNGRHKFATNFREHKRNVLKYQILPYCKDSLGLH